ncbi:hypothetical protein LTR16_012487, partial [Cryomyces antarcticus]
MHFLVIVGAEVQADVVLEVVFVDEVTVDVEFALGTGDTDTVVVVVALALGIGKPDVGPTGKPPEGELLIEVVATDEVELTVDTGEPETLEELLVEVVATDE